MLQQLVMGCVEQDGLRERLGKQADNPKTRVRSAPFVQIPLGVTEDRLVGTVDIEASMKVQNSYAMWQPGIYMALCLHSGCRRYATAQLVWSDAVQSVARIDEAIETGTYVPHQSSVLAQ